MKYTDLRIGRIRVWPCHYFTLSSIAEPVLTPLAAASAFRIKRVLISTGTLPFPADTAKTSFLEARSTLTMGFCLHGKTLRSISWLAKHESEVPILALVTAKGT